MVVYELMQAQQKAAYDKQQKEIADLKDFVARNKARVATRNMAMSRQKKLDNMDMIELAEKKPKPEFNFKIARTPGKYIFTAKDLVIGYDEPLSKPLNFEMERGKKVVLVDTDIGLSFKESFLDLEELLAAYRAGTIVEKNRAE